MQNNLAEEIQIIPIILIGISLLILMSAAIVLFFYLSRKKIVKTELEKATLEIQHQREMLQTTLLTQEDERKRIAQDLHDDISSKLNIVSLHASLVREEGITPQEANTLGAKIAGITTTVLESSRRIAHALLPPSLEKFGLVAALEELCDQLESSKKYEITTVFQYEEEILPKDHELHVFRIVQELINNTVKYADAKTVNLSLQSTKNTLHLHYEDDGNGFDLSEGKKAKGLGLSGIKNRAAIIGATISLQSQPQKGMSLDVVKQLT
ncbi:MAG: two-component sensor histidine kinase [Flavobacteriaceae bacterium]|nr:two-component sensor histidine kinase [Flavobacteriaceae bacterium]